MTPTEKAKHLRALMTVQQLKERLHAIAPEGVAALPPILQRTAFGRFIAWNASARRLIREYFPPDEAARFEKVPRFFSYNRDPQSKIDGLDGLMEKHLLFLANLEEDLENHPNLSTSKKDAQPNTDVSAGVIVFIVHGHDEPNKGKLQNLLRDEFGLESIILSLKPGKGRTLIEKFEQEATRASFAFVLLTPDDQVMGTGGQYTQARPNVVFELGWFYGRLGRDRACILFRRGTKIHSDLDGVSYIEFDADLKEKLPEIRRELEAAGIIPKQKE